MTTGLVREGGGEGRGVIGGRPQSVVYHAIKLRVCVVAPSLGILGGQSVVAQRLLAQLRQDADLDMSFLPHDPPLPGLLRHLRRIKYVRTIATSVAYLTSLFRHIRRQDVLHVFSASYWSFLLAPAPAILIGRALGKRVIVNYRSGEAADHLAKWSRTAIPILRRANLIVVPSGYLVDVFARFGLSATPINNFVDISAIRHRQRGPLRPLFLANRNFAPHYNVACVLRAFQIIQQQRPEAQLVVAGDGAERDALHVLARELKLMGVAFVGQVPPAEMPSLYDAADVYLNAPDVDNMPNSVIEAFAAGLPVITTNAGGIPYIVTDGENGLMSDPGDFRSLARNALRVLEDGTLAHRLSARGRLDVERKYTWPSVHVAWRSAYGLHGPTTEQGR